MDVRPVSRDGGKCPVCGQGTLHDSVREESVEYRGQTFLSMEPGAYCDTCGDGIAYPNPDGEEQWLAFRKRVDEAERHELSQIRAHLGLTQLEASKISGGGHNAFSRYERGEAQPVLAVLHLFRLLNRHPQLMWEVGFAPVHGIARLIEGGTFRLTGFSSFDNLSAGLAYPVVMTALAAPTATHDLTVDEFSHQHFTAASHVAP